MQEEEAVDGIHAAERLDWIAVDGGLSDIFDLHSVSGGVDHTFTDATFEAIEGDAVLLASMQTMNGEDTASLRFKELSNDSARLQIAEESSHDRERWHVKEDVAYLAGVEGSFTLNTIT